ncbi:MAG TPA: ATP-binding cassette domain-containing protein, partial [Candidatus Limnocylindrales bacterium]
LAGISVPESGTVAFRGTSIDAMGDAERSRLRRTAFGFVFQFGQLVPELSAIENVALPLLLNGQGRGPAERVAASWFPRLGLEGLEERRAGEMSGGQAQRVAIARALVVEPAVIFADEPTGSLDSLAGEHVMEMLTRAATEQGAAVVLVTHDARVAAYAHREIIVRDGRLSGADRP